MAHDVFISYSHKDSYVAQAICAKLEENRIRCWYAPRNIPPGAEWASSIISALKASKVMILVFTDFSNASVQVRREIDNAITAGVPIIPFKLSSAKPEGGMEYYLSTLHWLDAMDKPLEKSIDDLLKLVNKVLEKGSNSISSDRVTGTGGEGGLSSTGVLKLIFSVPILLVSVGAVISLFFLPVEKPTFILILCGAVLLLILGLHMLLTPLLFRKKNKIWIVTASLCTITVAVGIASLLLLKASMPQDLQIKDHGQDASMNISNNCIAVKDNNGYVYYADCVLDIHGIYKAPINDFKNNKIGECIVPDVKADNLALTDDNRLIYRDISALEANNWKLISVDLNTEKATVLVDGFCQGCYASDNWVMYSDRKQIKVTTSDGSNSLTYLDTSASYNTCYQDDLYFIGTGSELFVSEKRGESSVVSSLVKDYFIVCDDTIYYSGYNGIFAVPLSHTDVTIDIAPDKASSIIKHDRYLYYINEDDDNSLYRVELVSMDATRIKSNSYMSMNIIDNCLYLKTNSSEYERLLVV